VIHTPLLALLLAGAAGSEEEIASPAWIHVTPTTVEVAGEGPRPAQHAIARALEDARPGSVVIVEGGDYPAFTIGMGTGSPTDAATSGGEDGFPIVVQGAGGVRVLGRTDAVAVDQKAPNGNITFRNITFVPGQRAGVIFYRQGQGRVHHGYAFEDCHVLGAYDHPSASGPRSKWGVMGHSLASFRFQGVREPARIENIEKEHAFYIQNHRGTILIENVHAKGLGRTFCQFTARTGEGPPGTGDITVRNCVVSDACVAEGDGFKGGSAFTFAGRLDATILLENNVYRAGFDSAYRHLTRPGQPYGTGAVAAWQGGQPQKNGTLILRDNRFLMNEGCGDRPVVAIGGTQRVLLVGRNELRSGGTWPALALDPVTGNGNPVSSPNGDVYLAPLTKLDGDVTLRGQEPTRAQLAALRRDG
jgi:hypothetical protein